MSNILLVIGNGFDIECGLSSRYIDFYEQVIKREGQLKWHEQTRPRDFWHILLRCYANINDVQNKNWCDIERIIKKTLALIFIPTNPIKETLFDVAYQHGIGPSRVSFITKYNGAPINHFIANYC